jgi:formylglycine-generating enzyme required for sulfatase activity
MTKPIIRSPVPHERRPMLDKRLFALSCCRRRGANVSGEASPSQSRPTKPSILGKIGCGSGTVTVSLASRCTAPLSSTQERALKPKDSFKECDNCPRMVVVPSGSFTVGSPDGEVGRYAWEGPQRTIPIGKPFAVGKFHITVDQFAAFVAETSYDAGSKCWDLRGW